MDREIANSTIIHGKENWKKKWKQLWMEEDEDSRLRQSSIVGPVLHWGRRQWPPNLGLAPKCDMKR